jgi:hypothetical protein
MFKKLLILAALLFQLAAVSGSISTARADDPEPGCFPCAM